MRFENVGTELVRIGINNKMGSTSIKAINGLKNFRTFDEDKVTVVLLRDAFSKFKSGYLQELNGFFTFEPPPLTNYLLNSELIDEEISISDNSVEDILQNLHGGRAPSKSKQMFGLTTNPNMVEFWSRVSRGYYKTFTLDDEVTRDGLEIMSKLHGIDRNIGWIYYNHGIFWKWNTINNISLFELGQYSNVYFLELEDLSNLKFLKWLQEKDSDWNYIQEIPHKNIKSNSILEKQLDIFWTEYYNDDILRNKKLFNPLNKGNFYFNAFTNPKRVFGGDVEPNSFLLHTIPVRNFTPIHMLNFILESQQKEVDYIRKFNKRYITL
jgi:hypothetical protein